MSEPYFRAKAHLVTGEYIYDSSGDHILCYPAHTRESLEQIKRAFYDRQDYAYSPALHEFRPAWCFPKGVETKRVIGFSFEDDSCAIDEAACLITGEVARQETARLRVSSV
jgi:hypothetical protein